jgi:thiol-disulfide isomerase/thioredoxin
MRHLDSTARRRLLIAVAALGLAIVVAFALDHYGSIFFRLRSGEPLPLVASTQQSAAPSPAAFEFQPLDPPRELPDLRFIDGAGRSTSLADFRGRLVLLNLWATWCVPCRREMPALDRLQATLGKEQFIVLPLSIDRGGVPPVERFYEELGLKTLGVFVDQSGASTGKLATTGVPTTLLIDREGREVGRLLGAAEWDSPEAIALIHRYLNSPPGAGAGTGAKT